MALPAVKGDVIQGQCVPGAHQVPSPSGSPIPSPGPLPFAGPLNAGLVESVTIGGKAVAVVGSAGDNKPPHVGLHGTDPVQVNVRLQVGRVVSGSPTVTFGGKPAATSDSRCTTCGGTGSITCTTTNVTIN